ncbi:hypothetical protein AYI70_g10017 [Smittium culicis]|uniref:Uncharacterized protein n=1 Tax=Smittium culicis TaxID=133412 RepID=A0A1R1X8L5_9FUNG|nr:hypothetical protein AYI70_g10017 [Smittium culicis]
MYELKAMLLIMEKNLSFKIPKYIRARRKAEITEYISDVLQSLYRDEPIDKYEKLINLIFAFNGIANISKEVDGIEFTHFRWRDGNDYILKGIDIKKHQEFRHLLSDVLTKGTD